MALQGLNGALPKPLSDTALEREFYKYYQPPVAVPSSDDGTFAVPGTIVVPKVPRSSRDTALTAFAQLGALRLNCRRSMISFFDRKHQYVLAEATKTLSLRTDTVQDEEDALWLGTSIIPKGNGMCEHTAQTPVMYADVAAGDLRELAVAVINDMTKDSRFKGMPYVLGAPHARFYAGVPIRSPDGHNIGSYCVIDDKPRDGLNEQELVFLRDMSMTVMRHLEMVRAKEEHRRSGRMVRGLGSFIEGKATMRDWWLKTGHRSQQEPEATHTFAAPVTPQHIGSQHLDGATGQSRDFSRDPLSVAFKGQPFGGRTTQSSTESLVERNSAIQQIARQATSPASSIPSTPTPGSEVNQQHLKTSALGTTKQHSDLQEELISGDVKQTFSRAANIIREAIEVDGVIFLDASIGSWGGMVGGARTARPERHQTDDTDFSASANTNDDDISKSGSSTSVSPPEPSRGGSADEDDKRTCGVLGYSIPDKPHINRDNQRAHPDSVTESFLKGLLRKYPHGKVFNLAVDETGSVSSGESSEDYSSSLLVHTLSVEKRWRGLSAEGKRKRLRRIARKNDAKVIMKSFPGARSLTFVPLWDLHRERWFAGAICWTDSPTRVLTTEGELSYLAAFGDSIMAEVARCDAQSADRAKADFISSISHELRSPLHGILGSVEFLQDTFVDAFQENLIYIVETCGKTLLDTMDHLLDFAKINNFTRIKDKRDSEGETRRRSPGGHVLDGTVDLSVVTEEVLETVFAGYDYQRTAAPKERDKGSKEDDATGYTVSFRGDQQGPPKDSGVNGGEICVIVDIDRASDSHWTFNTQAGAWRRILMNVVGNALKYTDHGFIKVRLEAQPLPNKHDESRSRVTLTVTDSGRGISKEYLRDRLFTPFAQEDPLTVGTGLGLSIVRQIITSMGGEIDVQSEKGHGTEIKVRMIMTHTPVSKESLEQSNAGMVKARGRRVGLVGFEARREDLDQKSRAPEHGDQLFLSSFHKLCTDWFNVHVYPVALPDLGAADVLLTTESGLEELKSRMNDGKDGKETFAEHGADIPPVIVLCRTASLAHSCLARDSEEGLPLVVEYISQSCGPRKLAKALSKCLDRHSLALDSESRSVTPRQHSASDRTDRERNGSGTGLFPDAVPDNIDPETPDSPLKHPSLDTLSIAPLRIPGYRGEIDRPDIEHRQKSGRHKLFHSASGGDKITRHRSAMPARAASAVGDSRPSSSPTDAANPTRPFTILMVDDNRINLQLLVTYMNRNRHTYETATNGLEAVETYKSHSLSHPQSPRPQSPSDASSAAPFESVVVNPSERPKAFDVVLMDISMPIMDGLEATRNIRQYERERGLKPSTVIALTGLASATAQQEAFSSGVDIFLTKPVRLKELTKILERVR